MKRKHSTRRIPDEIREQVKILAIEGLSDRNISKKLNISKTAVNRIKKEIDDLGQLRAIKKREMAESLWNLAIEMKEQITKKKLKESSAARLVISLATLIDKALLLIGEATDRLEVKTEAELDHELKELQVAERELKKAWKKAEEQRRKAAEEGEKSSAE